MKTSELVKRTYDQIAQGYYKKWGKYSGFFLKHSKDFIKKLPQKGKILDLGCGTGRDSKWFSEKGFDVVGVDFSKGMLKVAKKVTPKAKFILRDFRRLKLPAESFDGIWCSFVFLHLKRNEVSPLLKRIKKFLKDGGVIFITTKQGKGEIIEPEHLNKKLKMFETFFEKSELENLVKKASYKILKSTIDTHRKESEEKIIIILAQNTSSKI